MALLHKHTIRSIVFSIFLVVLYGCAGRGGIYNDDGLSLVPPPDSTYDSKTRDMKMCLYAALQIETATNILTPFEMSPLRGQPTGHFLKTTIYGDPIPCVDSDTNPKRAATLMLAGLGQSNISDRYIICLLGKEYKWPASIPAATNKTGNSDIPLTQESASLYEAARQYRYYGGAPAEAERLLRRVIAIDEKTLQDDHPGMISNLGELAIALLEQNHTEEGLQYVNRLLPIVDHAKGRSINFLAWIFEHYAIALSSKEDREYITKLLATAKQLRAK